MSSEGVPEISVSAPPTAGLSRTVTAPQVSEFIRSITRTPPVVSSTPLDDDPNDNHDPPTMLTRGASLADLRAPPSGSLGGSSTHVDCLLPEILPPGSESHRTQPHKKPSGHLSPPTPVAFRKAFAIAEAATDPPNPSSGNSSSDDSSEGEQEQVAPKWPEQLTIVRHGQSEQNAALDLEDLSMAMGQDSIRDADIKLTQLGEWQAIETGKYFAARALATGERFDRIFVSPYQRAIRTAQLLAAQLPYKTRIYKDNRLREKSFGRLHGLLAKSVAELYPEEVHMRKRDGKYWYRFPQGENYPDVEARCHSFLDKLSRDYGGKRVLVVTHQVPFKMFRALFQHLDEKLVLQLDDVYNVGLQEYRIDRSRTPQGRCKLVMWNRIAYNQSNLPSTISPEGCPSPRPSRMALTPKELSPFVRSKNSRNPSSSSSADRPALTTAQSAPVLLSHTTTTSSSSPSEQQKQQQQGSTIPPEEDLPVVEEQESCDNVASAPLGRRPPTTADGFPDRALTGFEKTLLSRVASLEDTVSMLVSKLDSMTSSPPPPPPSSSSSS